MTSGPTPSSASCSGSSSPPGPPSPPHSWSTSSACGVLTCIRGLSAFLGPPLGGFVIDATSPEKLETDEVDTSNYEVAFYISACLLGTASIGHMISYAIKRASQKNKQDAP